MWCKRCWVAGVPVEDFDRHRAAFTVAQQPDNDLQLASLLVSIVATLGKRTGPSLEIARRDVVEHQGVVKVSIRQLVLDRALAFE